MKVEFSLASSTDEPRLLEMMEEFYRVEHLNFDPAIARQALGQLFSDRHYGLIYFICADQVPVGYVVLAFSFSLEFHGRDAFVDELYLRPSYRGQGLGRAALRHIEEVCVQEQIKALHLEADRSNTRAQQVYRAAGFQDHDRYLLTKWLDRSN